MVLAALIPVGAFSAYLVLTIAAQQRETAEDRSTDIVHDVVSHLDASFRRSIGILEVLAASPALDSGDLAAFDREARRAAAILPEWFAVVLSDVDSSRQVVNTLVPFGAAMPAVVDTESVAAMLEDPRPRVANLLMRPALTPEPLVPVRVPVFRDGRLRYILSAGIRTGDLWEVLRGAGIPDSWLGVVVDRKGIIVTRTRGEQFVGRLASLPLQTQIAGRRQGWYQGRSLEGERFYTVFFTSPLTGWSVHLGIPAEEVEGPQQRSLLFFALAGLASIGLALLLAALVARDIRQRRRAERALEQAQRAEILGRMTSSVAHDFNNTLMVIVSIFEHLEHHEHLDSRSTSLLATGLGAIERGRNLTQQLLAFTSNQALKPEPANINALITDLARLIRRAVGPAVDLRLELAAQRSWCEVDVPQLESALLNLAVNARDAMPDGGTLTIATSNPPGRTAALAIAVTDTGQGIPPDLLGRVFDPFFTTKPAGKGTGLGLSQVQGFVKQSQGLVEIESRVGKGTTIRLVLPCGAAQPAAVCPAPADRSAPAAPPAPSGRRLVRPRPSRHRARRRRDWAGRWPPPAAGRCWWSKTRC